MSLNVEPSEVPSSQVAQPSARWPECQVGRVSSCQNARVVRESQAQVLKLSVEWLSAQVGQLLELWSAKLLSA